MALPSSILKLAIFGITTSKVKEYNYVPVEHTNCQFANFLLSMKDASSSSLETEITGSFLTRFWLELFGNSAHFPIANVLFELLLEKPFLAYLGKPDVYVIITAALVQAYFLARWQSKPRQHRFWGNLIAPSLYTVIEGLLEGPKFFAAPHHLAYWGFSLAIGAFQALRLELPSLFAAPLVVVENVTRTSILFFMYAIFETYANPAQTSSLSAFFGDGSHRLASAAGRTGKTPSQTSTMASKRAPYPQGKALSAARFVRCVLFLQPTCS